MFSFLVFLRIRPTLPGFMGQQHLSLELKQTDQSFKNVKLKKNSLLNAWLHTGVPKLTFSNSVIGIDPCRNACSSFRHPRTRVSCQWRAEEVLEESSSISAAASRTGWPLSQTHCWHWPELAAATCLGLGRPCRLRSAYSKASRLGSLCSVWFCSSFAERLTQAQGAFPIPFTDRGEQLPALPAAIHQHNETLPYWSITHRELNLSQRHFSPAVRQLHRKSF